MKASTAAPMAMPMMAAVGKRLLLVAAGGGGDGITAAARRWGVQGKCEKNKASRNRKTQTLRSNEGVEWLTLASHCEWLRQREDRDCAKLGVQLQRRAVQGLQHRHGCDDIRRVELCGGREGHEGHIGVHTACPGLQQQQLGRAGLEAACQLRQKSLQRNPFPHTSTSVAVGSQSQAAGLGWEGRCTFSAAAVKLVKFMESLKLTRRGYTH